MKNPETAVARKDDIQAGPLMVRHIVDGHEYLLPADAILEPRITDDKINPEEKLSGTW